MTPAPVGEARNIRSVAGRSVLFGHLGKQIDGKRGQALQLKLSWQRY